MHIEAVQDVQSRPVILRPPRQVNRGRQSRSIEAFQSRLPLTRPAISRSVIPRPPRPAILRPPRPFNRGQPYRGWQGRSIKTSNTEAVQLRPAISRPARPFHRDRPYRGRSIEAGHTEAAGAFNRGRPYRGRQAVQSRPSRQFNRGRPYRGWFFLSEIKVATKN